MNIKHLLSGISLHSHDDKIMQLMTE